MLPFIRKMLLRYKVATLLIMFAFFIVWEVLAQTRFLNLYIWYFFRPPSTILSELIYEAVSLKLLYNALFSLYRISLGFVIAALIGVPFGLVVGWSRLGNEVFGPLIDLFRPMPHIALYPLLVLIFGLGDQSKIFLVTLQCFFIITIGAMYGGRSVDRLLVNQLKVMGAGDKEIFLDAVIWSAMPFIFSALRLSIAVSWIALVTSEMIGATEGIGWSILFYEKSSNFAGMFAYIFVISILAGLMLQILLFAERRLLRWHRALAI
jgi:ABC-type nitrate/sulfonate/bicarbonate transport system permease component